MTGHTLIEKVETNKGKILLHQMDVRFPEGAVTGILGPSGSGKSTLLSVMTDSIQSNLRGAADGR